MALAETVSREGHDHLPHLLCRVRIPSQSHGSGKKLLRVRGEVLGGTLLGERLPQAITSSRWHAREGGAYVHYVLLVYHDAERLDQRVAQAWIERLVGRAIAQPLEVNPDVLV